MGTFIDDYLNQYRTPYIPQKVIGFSGIDPSSVCDCNGAGGNGGLSEDEINQLIALYISNLTIRIDSGRLDGDEPVVPTLDLRTKDIPHNALDGLQGGQNGEYYHLTEAELAKLRAYPLYANLMDAIKHEELPDLLGGTANGHYHLTDEELDNLRKLIAALMPAGTVIIPSGGTGDHEVLSNLLGGDINGHYHMTGSEWTKIKALIAATFPSGSTVPVFPSGPVEPVNPDDPDNPIDDPYNPDNPTDDPDRETDAGLPPSEPPSWGVVQLPNNYELYEGAGNMYYGTILQTNFPEALVVPTRYNGGTTTIYLRATQDLVSWNSYMSYTIGTLGKMLVQILYVDWNTSSMNNSSYRRHYRINYPSTATNVYFRYNSAFTSSVKLAQGATLVAGTYAPSLSKMIFITETGAVSHHTGTVNSNGRSRTFSQSTTAYDSKLGAVNFGCALWLEAPKRFCVTGKDGVSVSSLGEAWTKKTGDGITVPKDLCGLTFRADIEYKDSNNQTYSGCAFGWSRDDKTFWKSYDGEHWMRHNAKPIPLKEIKSVAYSPEFGMYCAVGTSKTDEDGLYVYLSKDLAGWRKSKVSGDTMVVESVIWMASTKKFVLYPTSGSYLYTFSPADWSE